MKSRLIIAIVGTILLVLGGALTGLCEEADNARASLIYGAFVDHYIQKCAAKAELLDSGSFNIRKSALQATVKGAFIQSNRTSIIKYLKENDVPLNAHRIQYHLNQKFAQSVYGQNLYALLLKDQAGH